MKRKQPFWVRLFSPVRLKTQKIYVAGSHPRVRLTAFNIFVGIGSFLVAFLLGSVLMIPGESNAEDVSVLSNDASLSVALTPEAMNLAVTPTPGGTLASDELAIQISTDNTTGYALTLALAGAESSLYDPASGGEIQAAAATIGNPTTLAVNTWGWYPDSLANNTGNLFSALPSSSDPYELKKTSSPTSGSGDTTTISFGVNVDTTLPAGSYTNAIVISAVTNYVPQPILDVYPTTGWAGDTITLYSNGGFINVQSVQIGGTDCTSINVKSADELTCVLPSKAETDTTSGTDNGYSISVTASNTSLDTHNFTIRYFNPSTTTSMQEFTGTTCGSMSVGDIISLTDERNGQTYRIKKMQDNKCWMVDNIKYKGEGITISNVDGTEGIIHNDGYNKFNTVDGTSTQNTQNSDKAFYNNPMVGSYCYGTSIQSSYTKCGYLYNWYAATAGAGTYNASTHGANISGSICPIGWRLPSVATVDGTVYTEADFSVLNASMNAGYLTSGLTDSSYYAGWQFTGDWFGVFSGYWDGIYQGFTNSGYYWSSTSYMLENARAMNFDGSSVYPANIGPKYLGYAVRCVMDSLKKVEITYDANGGYFNGDSSKTTNSVVYSVDELPVVTANKSGSGSYGETITVSDATSLSVKFSCDIWDSWNIGGVGLNGHYICSGNTAESGTLTLLGDTVEISAYADVDYSYDLTIRGTKVTIVSGDEELVPVRPGYTFLGWYKDANLDASDEFIAVDATTSTGTVYAKWAKDPLTITFNGNGNTGGSMTNQTVDYGGSIVLNTNNYTRPGYDFFGWNTKADGSGDTYYDGATYDYSDPIDADEVTLYAQWGRNLLSEVTYMQDITASHCANSANGVTATLQDRRDNNTYTIAKINGNCWMTQDLRLSGGRTLTVADSNVENSWDFPISQPSDDSYTEARSLIRSGELYGGYYNYCAASAGTVCSRSTVQDATYDICPKGWHLPTSDEINSIARVTDYVSAFSPIQNGYYINGSFDSYRPSGQWWSATALSNTAGFSLILVNGDEYLFASNNARSYWVSVRCVAQ